MRENRLSGLMRGGARRSLALCLLNPSAPPTLLKVSEAARLRSKLVRVERATGPGKERHEDLRAEGPIQFRRRTRLVGSGFQPLMVPGTGLGRWPRLV